MYGPELIMFAVWILAYCGIPTAGPFFWVFKKLTNWPDSYTDTADVPVYALFGLINVIIVISLIVYVFCHITISWN